MIYDIGGTRQTNDYFDFSWNCLHNRPPITRCLLDSAEFLYLVFRRRIEVVFPKMIRFYSETFSFQTLTNQFLAISLHLMC